MKRAPLVTTLSIAIAIGMYAIEPYNITGVIAGMAITWLLFFWAGRLILKSAVKKMTEK
jgi:divalent metal cation (Fe/Co/Zn/Cd) transporter